MTSKSFIKIKPITVNSENHNTRKIKPKYLLENPEKENLHVGKSLSEIQKNQAENWKKFNSKKRHKKATPIREAVVLLPNDDNNANYLKIKELTDDLQKRYGIKAFQWHIHNDEGHTSEEGKKKYNYHAHILFDWTDHKTSKIIRLNKEDMADIQTLTAHYLGMERGQKKSKSLSLNHHEYRGFLKAKDALEKDLKIKLDRQQQKTLREQILKEKQHKTIQNDRPKRTREENQGRERRGNCRKVH